MARELTINNITDHVFDAGTTIYLSGTSILDGTTTPLTINLDNFLLKEDEERLKIDFVDYANSIISQNILNSNHFQETVGELVEEEISNNLASEDSAGSVCAISSYSDNTTGDVGDAPLVYKVDYINSALNSIRNDTNNSIRSVESTFSASLTALSTKVASNTIEIDKNSTLSNTLKSNVNSLSNEVSQLSGKIEEVNNVADKVLSFNGRLNTLENKKVEENPTILSIQEEIENLKSSTATKTQLDSIKNDTNDSIKSVERDLSASLSALSTKVANNTNEIDKASTLSNTLKSSVNTISNEVSQLSEKMEAVNNVATTVSNFDGRLKTLENTSVEENPTIISIQEEIENLKSSAATKTQLDAIASVVADTSKIDAINNRIAPLETEVEKISAKNLEQDKAIAKNNTTISETKDEISEIETEVKKDIENLWAHAQDCNNQIVSLTNNTTEADTKVLEDAKTYADSKLSKISSGTTAELSRLEASITNLTSNLDNNKTDAYIDDAGRVYMSFDSAFRVLIDKNAIRGVGDTVEGTLMGILEDCANIHAQVDAIEESFGAFQTSQESKNNEIQSTIAQVEAKCDSECVTINTRIDELVEKIVKVECTTTALEPEIQALKEQVSILKTQVISLNRQYQSLAQLNDAIEQNGLPMFADYFTENESDVSSAPISSAKTIYIKVPSPAGTLYYKIPLSDVESDNCILLEEASQE